MAGEGTRSAGLAIGAREAQWVAKLLRIPAEPVLESIESSKAINQKASTCLPEKGLRGAPGREEEVEDREIAFRGARVLYTRPALLVLGVCRPSPSSTLPWQLDFSNRGP